MPDAMTIWLIAIIAVIVLLLILLLVVGGRSRKAARREHEQHQRDSQLASTEEHRPSSGPWSDSAQRGSGATGAAAGAVAPAAFAGSSALTHRTDAAGTGVSVDEADAGQQVQSGTQAGAAADSERQGTFPSVLNTAEGADTQGDKSGAVAPGVAGGTGVAVDQVAEQDRVTSDDAATASDAAADRGSEASDSAADRGSEASATGAAGAGAAGAGAAVLGSQATTQKVSEPGVAGGSGVAVDQAPVSAGGEQDGGQAPVADASGEAAHAAHAHSDASDAAHTAEHERSSADDAAAPVPAGYEATGVPGFAAPVPDEVRERVERERAAEEAAEAAGNREVSVNEARDAMGRDTHTEHRDEDVQDSEGEEELIVPAAQQSTSVPGTVPLAGTPEFEEMEREREAAESGPEAEERRQEAEQAERDRAETIEAGRRSAAEATGEDASHDEDEELIVPAGHQATDIPGTAPLAGTPEAEQLQAAGDGEQGATDARDSAPHDAAEDRDADHVDLDAEEVNFGTAQDDDAHIAEADIDYPQVSVVPIEDAEHAGTHSSADAAPAADSGDEWVAIEDGGADQAAAFQGDVRSAGATDAPQVDKLARAQEARWS